jgi:hypothetical protein
MDQTVKTNDRHGDSRPTERRRFGGWARIPMLFGLLLAIQGCAALATPWGYGAASTASYINTQKFFGDHLVSAVTGRDCTVVEIVGDLLKSEEVCMPPQALVEAPLFCRKTLGAFDCYREPNPYGPKRKHIADATSPPLSEFIESESGTKAGAAFTGGPERPPQATEPERRDESPSI